MQGYWYIASQSKALRRSKPLAVKVDGQRLVLFRDEEGKASAVVDRCAHRNAKLSEGRVRNGCISCPYHGWEYNGKGELVRHPSLRDCSQLKKISIEAWSCLEQDGFIWVARGEPASPKPVAFPFYRQKGWTSFVMQTRFKAPVASCLENFLDCPHAVFVHKGWFRSQAEKHLTAKVVTLDDGAKAVMEDEPRQKSVVFGLLSQAKKGFKHTDRFIAPSTSRVDYEFSDGKHYIIMSSCTPITDDETLVYTVINFKSWKIGPLARLIFEPLSKFVIHQDVRILNSQHGNVKKYGKEDFTYTPADLLGPHIVAWRNAIASGKTPPKAGLEKHVDITL